MKNGNGIGKYAPLERYKSRLHAAFTDLDGTAVNNERRALIVIGEEIDRYIFASESPNISPRYKEKGIGDIGYLTGTPIPSIREIFSRKVGIEIPHSVEAAIMKRRANEPEAGEVVTRIEELVDFFRYLKGEGVKIRIVTSSERGRATGYVRAAALEITQSDKDLISGYSDFSPPRQKPHPDAYAKALSDCKAHAHHTITFEDTVHGGQASIALDIPTIGVLLGSHIPEDRKESIAEEMLGAGFAGVIAKPSDFIPVVEQVLSKLPEHRVTYEAVATRPAMHVVGGNKGYQFGDDKSG